MASEQLFTKLLDNELEQPGPSLHSEETTHNSSTSLFHVAPGQSFQETA